MAYVDELPDKASLNSHLLLIRPLEGKYHNRFLFWLMSSSVITGYTEYSQDGTIMASLSQEKIGNFLAYFPGLEEQCAIADFLDAQCAKIDSVIADIEKQIETLQKYKKSLITETVTKGLDRTVPMKDSGIVWIGEVPEHWDLKRLKFMLENSSDSMKVGPFGSALSGSDFTDEGKWVYNQRVVLDKNFSENTTFISEEKYREMRGFSVYPGDILITTRGTIGKVAIVPEGAQEGILHPCIIKFRVNKEMMMPELLELVFNESDFVKDQFTLMSNATTIEVIYSYSLKDIILPVIPTEEQKKIYSYLSEKCATIDAVLAEKQKALSAIIQHKKSLIYEYVTGKKRVTEVN
jgi:type I restriction enzyme S subunit